MNIFNRAHNELQELGFQLLDEVEHVNSLGCSLYSNRHFHVLVKYYSNPTESVVRDESTKIREALFHLNYNVWNSYFLVCIDSKFATKDFVYTIEKDTKGVKKYVISDIKDFNRIAIFDKGENNIDFKMDSSNTDSSSDILEIVDTVKSHKGAAIKFSNEKVSEIVDKIMNGMINKNEN
ncbi:ABC-three component system middle component 1 [Priestia aryabhattai]|uniref:ABC-three component system middle component 1 n=1 Tax=Priestia TaxID=2800373 RepID=UPI003F8AEADF